jgi:hypothetical protein
MAMDFAMLNPVVMRLAVARSRSRHHNRARKYRG